MKNPCGMVNAEGVMEPVRLRAESALPISHSPFPIRTGVTLVELLITMTIMAIIAAAVLGTAAGAIESAREKRTQMLITKIHALVMDHLATYETRRVEVAPQIANAINSWATAGTTPADMRERNIARGQMLADARLLTLRELMKKEMPDRWEDVTHVPVMLTQAPPLAQTYFRRYQQIISHPERDTHAAAECLYLFVMSATGDGEARTLFSKQDIADTDGDGAPEFVDGWGRPIGWMRWAPGVTSDLQPRNPNGSRPSEVDHDPFDIYRRDTPTVTLPNINLYPAVAANATAPSFRDVYQANMRIRMMRANGANMTHQIAYRLTPLIYSAGPDGSSDMLMIRADGLEVAPIDPYLAASTEGFIDGTQTGAPGPDGESKDNITNHLIEY